MPNPTKSSIKGRLNTCSRRELIFFVPLCAESLFSVGLYDAEVGGISDQHMKDLRASARGASGKGASLTRSAALELIAHGGPFGDPRVAAERGSDALLLGRRAGRFVWLPGKGP
eukprot:4875065-Amphidinium_carterae.1